MMERERREIVPNNSPIFLPGVQLEEERPLAQARVRRNYDMDE